MCSVQWSRIKALTILLIRHGFVFLDSKECVTGWRFSPGTDQIVRLVQTLSGSQKQRVAIAGGLVEECKVLLLDELKTFLDESDQCKLLVVAIADALVEECKVLLLDELTTFFDESDQLSLENGSSSTHIAHMKPDIIAVAKTCVGIETLDGKRILPRIVLEAIPFELIWKNFCLGKYVILPFFYFVQILDQLFDISLSLPRPIASSYTTPTESPYAALSSLWDNVVLAYEPVWATGTGKVASPEQAREVS
nr:ABC transporter I family member 10-like [Tanacetum cinerariifolium]